MATSRRRRPRAATTRPTRPAEAVQHRRHRAAGHEPGGPDAGGRVAARGPGRREVPHRPVDLRAAAAAQAVPPRQRDAASPSASSSWSRPPADPPDRRAAPGVDHDPNINPMENHANGLEVERRRLEEGRPAGLRLGGCLVQPRAGARRRPARARPGRLPRPGARGLRRRPPGGPRRAGPAAGARRGAARPAGIAATPRVERTSQRQRPRGSSPGRAIPPAQAGYGEAGPGDLLDRQPAARRPRRAASASTAPSGPRTSRSSRRPT